MSRWTAALVVCFFAAACGGSFSPNDSSPPADGGTGGSAGNGTGGGGPGGGATGGSAMGGGGSAGAAGNDAGATCAPIAGCSSRSQCNDGCNTCFCSNGMWACTARACPADAGVTGRVPQKHRSSSAACPMDRPPGMIDPVCTMGSGLDQCKNDQDCGNGKNGRCYTNSGGARCLGNTCSFDDCFDDSNCQGNVPCECRSIQAHGANVCVANSNCRIDADCGPGGYCSRSGIPNCAFGYFCHTPTDECIDDTDCKNAGGFNPACSYDAKVAHWRCSNPCLPVP